MSLDYRKAKHGGTEKEILAYEKKLNKSTPRSKALKGGKNGFDYKGMMRDLDKAGYGGVKTSSLKGKSIRDMAK